MTVSAGQLIRNVTNMMGAYFGRKVITFIYFILVIRYADIWTTGFYFWLISFAVIITALHDFGLSSTLIREGSKSPEKLEIYLSNIITVKILFTVIMFVSGLVLVTILGYPVATKHWLIMLMATITFESFADTFYGCLRVYQKMKFEARAHIIGQMITLVIGGLSLLLYPSLYILVLALLLNQLYHFMYSFHTLYRELAIFPRFIFQKNLIFSLTKIAIPFMIAVFFGQLIYADTFILKYFTSDRIVGLFGAASCIVGVLRFIPGALEAVIFPLFSSFYNTAQEKLERTFDLFFELILIICVYFSLVISIFSEEIIHLVFSNEYNESISTLKLLAIALVPLFLSQPIGRLLDACNRQVIHTILLGITMILNIILTVIFIPFFGVIGIAVSCLISYCLFFGVGLYLSSHIIPFSINRALKNVMRGLGAGVCMSVVMMSIKSSMHYVPAFICGSLCYVFIVTMLRGITRNGFSRKRAYKDWLDLTKRVFE